MNGRLTLGSRGLFYTFDRSQDAGAEIGIFVTQVTAAWPPLA
jgi:hypothetical protein